MTTTTTPGIVEAARTASVQAPSATTQTTSTTSTSAPDVASWYRNDFGRDPDQAGMQFWQNALTGGADPNRIYSDFIAAGVRNGERLRGMSSAQGQPTATPAAASYQAAQLGTPTAWNVTPDQTVEGRVNNILNPNNPIIQQARSRAAAAANDRGLLNSSMAIGAGESAAYDAAIPIASADAQTTAKAAGYNADMSNQFAVHNVDSTNTASQFNAGAQNTLTGQKLAADTQIKTAQISADTQRTIAALDSTTRSSLAQLDAQTKTNLANLDSSTRTQLATIDADYHTLMQSNASAADLYRQVTQNITNISASKDMDAAAKQQAVNNQIQLLQNGMRINGAISNLNLGDLLNFSVNATPEAPAATTQAQASPTQFQSNFGGGGVGMGGGLGGGLGGVNGSAGDGMGGAVA